MNPIQQDTEVIECHLLFVSNYKNKFCIIHLNLTSKNLVDYLQISDPYILIILTEVDFLSSN